MKLTAEQKQNLEDLRVQWIDMLREQQAHVQAMNAQMESMFGGQLDALGQLGLDDEYHQVRDAHYALLVEQEEALYEALEGYIDPEEAPQLVPLVRPHFNPDPDSDEPAERAGLRVVEAPAVIHDNVNHEGYWGRKKRRHPDEVIWVAVHVTGVGNEVKGFATRSAHRKKHPGDMFLARGIRYQPLEYTTIFSWTDRGHWHNLPFWAYSYASTALNKRCIAWVYDGKWPKDRAVAQDIVNAAIASLLQTFEDLWDWKVEWNEDEELRAKHRKSLRGACDPMKTITVLAHRQGDKDRGADPGAQLWARVVMEAVRLWNTMWEGQRFRVEVAPRVSYGRGNPLPADWLEWSLEG